MQAGVPMLSEMQGDCKIPKIKTKPTFGWVTENNDFAEQDMDFDNVTATPKYAGNIQVFSWAIFLRSAGAAIQNFVQRELMNSFSAGVETAAVRADGSAGSIKGLYHIVPAANKIDAQVDANTGGKISYARCLETEAKILATNQNKPLVWLVNTTQKVKAQQELKFAVSGANQLLMNDMLADRKVIITNAVDSNIDHGTSKTSRIALLQPESLLLLRWTGGVQLQLNSMAESFWKKGAVGVRIMDALDFISRRPDSTASLDNLAN